MNEQVGWISIHRKVMNHKFYKERREYSKFEAWIDILLNVNHTPDDVPFGFETIHCGRGQSLYSLDTWADRWKWNKSKVNRFFEHLEKDGMITRENVVKTTRITVCNYDSYQDTRNASETPAKRKRNARETPAKPNNNENKENNENKDLKEKEEKDAAIAALVSQVEKSNQRVEEALAIAEDYRKQLEDQKEKEKEEKPPGTKRFVLKGDDAKARFVEKTGVNGAVSETFALEFLKFAEYRKSKRKTIVSLDQAHESIDEILTLARNDCETAVRIMKKSIANGWTGVFALPTNSTQHATTQKHHPSAAIIQPGKSFGKL